MKKLIAVDLDGTLLDSKSQIPPANKLSLQRARENGHEVVIITGREYFSSVHVAKELDFEKYGGILSSSNGANVYDFKKKKSIINHFLDRSIVKDMIESGLSFGFDYIVYHQGEILVENPRAHALAYMAQKNKLPVKVIENLKDKIDFDLNKLLFTGEAEIISEHFKEFTNKFSSFANPVNSMPESIDVMPRGIHKGRSLIEIAEHLGISKENTIAFGDEINDETMIEMAGVGVAMGNANEKIKEIADYISLTNDQAGVAYYLENVLGVDK